MNKIPQYGRSRKGGSLRTTLSIPEKKVRPKRRFGTPTFEDNIFASIFDFLEMAHTNLFLLYSKNSISALEFTNK